MKHCTSCFESLPNNLNHFKKSGEKLTGRCKGCISDYSKAYYQKNKEEFIRKNRIRTDLKREEINRKGRIYHHENREKRAEYKRKYYQKNKDRIKAYQIENRERSRILEREAYKNNPRKYLLKNAIRRHRMNSLISDFTSKDWESCLEYFDYSCAYCGSKKNLEQEHVIPVSKGGNYTVNNIVPACKSCNASKNNRPLEKWYVAHKSYSEENFNKLKSYLNNKTPKESRQP